MSSYWTLPLSALVGLALGFRLRPLALALLSAAVAAVMVWLCSRAGFGVAATTVRIVGVLTCLQVGYLIGAVIAHRH